MTALPSSRPCAGGAARRRPLPGQKARRVVLTVLFAVVLGLSYGACSDAGTAAAEEPQPPRLLRIEPVGASAPALEEQIRGGGFFRWALPNLDGWRVEVAAGKVTGGEETSRVEVLVGLLPLPEAVRRLAADLPVDLDGGEVRFDGTRYPRPGTSLILHLPGGTERWLVTGTDAESVADAANRVMIRAVGGRFWHGDAARDADYVVQETPWLLRIGRWKQAGTRWTVDPSAEQDDLADRDRWFAGLRPLDAGRVRLLVEPGSAEGAEGRSLRSLADALGAAAETMASRLGAPLPEKPPVTIAVEQDYVTQGRHTGAIGPAVAGGPADLHVVLDPADRWAVRQALARVLLERAGLTEGRPVWAVEGVALWLSRDWYGRPYAAWLPDLAAAHALPNGAELLAPERAGDDSAPLWTPVAAAVAARLPGETAAAKLAAFSDLTAPAAEEALAALERTAAFQDASPDTGEPPPAVVPLPAGFLRGVSFAMLNSLEGGYHAPGIGPRLDALARLGADSISLMPFAYQPDPRTPELRFLNGSPTSETDVGVIHAARAAHARGLSVLWKPHIWVSHGSWPGEVEMTSAADWAAWWRDYRRYILHHAFLARYAGAEMFSVGVELQRTVERPEWAELIADVRRIYHGSVTYCANWGGGADRAVFWNHLDAVGVDAYYPLSGEATGVSDTALAEGARRVVGHLADLARKTGKPVVLTEVGFAARRGTWSAPHEKGGEVSSADQARAYRALLGALERPSEDQGWLRGVYVWKAFSGDVSARGERADFRFMGRPAEAIVASFFRREDGAASRGSAR